MWIFSILTYLIFLWLFPSCRVAGITDDLSSPHCPVRLLSRSQSGTFQLSSFHLVFGRSLFLFPGISALKTFLSMCSPSLIVTCPYQFNIFSDIFLEACATLVVPLMCSFLILSLHVTPTIHRSILILVTSIHFPCLFVVAHVSAPYIIAGLITVLYIFPSSCTGILLSHCIPLHFFQFLQPAPTRFVSSVSIPPSSSILVSRYFKWVTLSSSSPSIFTGSRFPC